MHFWKLTAGEAEAGPQVQDHLGLHVCDVGMVRVHVMDVMCMSCVVVCVLKRCVDMMWVWLMCIRGSWVCVVSVYKSVGVKACGMGSVWYEEGYVVCVWHV